MINCGIRRTSRRAAPEIQEIILTYVAFRGDDEGGQAGGGVVFTEENKTTVCQKRHLDKEQRVWLFV